MYGLVVARGGPKLQASKLAAGTTRPAPGRNPTSAGISIGDKGMTMTAHGASAAAIARMISLQIGGTVVDKTGLTGTYDYTLEFAPDENMRAASLPPSGPPPSEAPGDSGPSIFTALQEQLGLKLEARKQPVDVIVIDHMERPTPN